MVPLNLRHNVLFLLEWLIICFLWLLAQKVLFIKILAEATLRNTIFGRVIDYTDFPTIQANCFLL